MTEQKKSGSDLLSNERKKTDLRSRSQKYLLLRAVRRKKHGVLSVPGKDEALPAVGAL